MSVISTLSTLPPSKGNLSRFIIRLPGEVKLNTCSISKGLAGGAPVGVGRTIAAVAVATEVAVRATVAVTVEAGAAIVVGVEHCLGKRGSGGGRLLQNGGLGRRCCLRRASRES